MTRPTEDQRPLDLSAEDLDRLSEVTPLDVALVQQAWEVSVEPWAVNLLIAEATNDG